MENMSFYTTGINIKYNITLNSHLYISTGIPSYLANNDSITECTSDSVTGETLAYNGRVDKFTCYKKMKQSLNEMGTFSDFLYAFGAKLGTKNKHQ